MTEKEFSDLFEDFFEEKGQSNHSKKNGSGKSLANGKEVAIKELLEKENGPQELVRQQKEEQKHQAYIKELQEQQRKRELIRQQKEEELKKQEALRKREEEEHQQAMIRQKLIEEERKQQEAAKRKAEQERKQQEQLRIQQEQQRRQQLEEQRIQQELQKKQQQAQQPKPLQPYSEHNLSSIGLVQQPPPQKQQTQPPPQAPQPQSVQAVGPSKEEMEQRRGQQQEAQLQQTQQTQQSQEYAPDQENEQVEVIRSEEIHEILTQIPNWMIRWGTSVVFGIIGTIVLMSWFIKYPDVIQGRITISTEQPPAPVVARAVGSINLFKTDGDNVRDGEVFAVINSATRFDDVSKLNRRLKENKKALNSGRAINIAGWEDLSLGQLQSSYNNLLTQIRQSRNLQQRSSNNQQRAASIDNQIAEVRALEQKQNKNLQLLEKDYRAAMKTLNERYKPLFTSGVISAAELENYENDVRQRQRVYEGSKVTVNETTSRLLQLENQKSELGFSEGMESLQTQNAITDAYSSLVGQIKLWEEQYLLRAPIAGKLNYMQFVKNNSYVQREQELAKVIPNEGVDVKDGMVGELFVPTAGTADLGTNQWVNVTLDDYPKQDYGMVRGKVDKISDIATMIPSGPGGQGGGEVYKVYVNFPEGLRTTNKKTLEFKHNMKGTAEVITEDVRLFHRIFKEIKNAFDKL